MFEVICIDNDFIPNNRPAEKIATKIHILRPQVGSVYTVVDEYMDGCYLEYQLAEIPAVPEGRFFWDARAFIRVGGPDERSIAAMRLKEDQEIENADYEARKEANWNMIKKRL
jgi:hypothetical protein